MRRAKDALASLPWVDQKTVDINVDKQQVRFGVSDMKQFDEDQLRKAFADKKFKDVKVLERPA